MPIRKHIVFRKDATWFQRTMYRFRQTAGWRRYWIAIDAIGVAGLALAASYYFSRSAAGAAARRAAIETLWAGFATNLVTVWLGVRIIDAIVRRRDLRISTRREIAANLELMTDFAAQMARGDASVVEEFDDVLDFLAPSATRDLSWSLDSRERRLVEQARAVGWKVLSLGRDLINLDRVAADHIDALDDETFAEVRETIDGGYPSEWLNVGLLKKALTKIAASAISDPATEAYGAAKMLADVALNYTHARRELEDLVASVRLWLAP
jgi:hypothetical protein